MISQKEYLKNLPGPFSEKKYKVLKKGIWDSDNTLVLMSETQDLAMLYPPPSIDYKKYTTRSNKLNLAKFKNESKIVKERTLKIIKYFQEYKSVLEIGSRNGLFLKELKKSKPNINLYSVEPDQNTKEDRSFLDKDKSFKTLDDALTSNVLVDVVCFFHVFEHIIEIDEFVNKIKGILNTNGILILEVPSLKDPLMTIYNSDAYSNFFFQSQHPFYYSPSSLKELFHFYGFNNIEVINHQRYGLDNHINWLKKGTPGLDKLTQDTFHEINDIYRSELEKSSNTDSFFLVMKY